MPFTKVTKQHQITIPKPVFEALELNPGDIVEVRSEKGKAVLIPKRVVSAAPTPSLSSKEQDLLVWAKRKIEAINKDILNSKGLMKAEADVAAKAGLIDPDQKYWWLEAWQKGEREAEKDHQEGRAKEFDGREAFLEHLDLLKANV